MTGKGDYGTIIGVANSVYANSAYENSVINTETTDTRYHANLVYANSVINTETTDTRYEDFNKGVKTLINELSLENNSNTPDFILADFLTNCLQDWDSISSYEQYMDADDILWDYLWLSRKTYRKAKTDRARWYLPVIAEKIAVSWWERLGKLWFAFLNNGNYSDAWKK